jgi:hypothetical protein
VKHEGGGGTVGCAGWLSMHIGHQVLHSRAEAQSCPDRVLSNQEGDQAVLHLTKLRST